MSRYRPPCKASSSYITLAGVLVLRKELQYLWMTKRPKITQAVSEAAAQGDRSENAEYIYGKKQLREIDSRVRFLRKRLDTLKVIEELPADKSKIYFGAWVTLENEDGEEKEIRIVGPDEFAANKQYISMDSPMAKALLGKKRNDDVVVDTPKGDMFWCIMGVSYREI